MRDQSQFDKIDLHLIRVLHTVLTERSVSRAAIRLGMHQPAVSAALKRLRDLAALQNAVTLFRERFGKGVEKLEDLVSTGLVAELPEDPLGYGFALDTSGWPKLNSTPSGTK